MTVHDLANVLEKLTNVFELSSGGLVKGTRDTIHDAAAAFRELPDQTLKDFLKTIKDKPAPAKSTKAKKAAAPAVDVPALVERIQAVQTSQTDSEPVRVEIASLSLAECRAVLEAFCLKGGRSAAECQKKILQLLEANPKSTTTPAESPVRDPMFSAEEQQRIEETVNTYTRLQDTPGMDISTIRSRFAEVRTLPKSLLEEVTRRLGFTPRGTRDELADYLQENLERITMSRINGELILSGK